MSAEAMNDLNLIKNWRKQRVNTEKLNSVQNDLDQKQNCTGQNGLSKQKKRPSTCPELNLSWDENLRQKPQVLKQAILKKQKDKVEDKENITKTCSCPKVLTEAQVQSYCMCQKCNCTQFNNLKQCCKGTVCKPVIKERKSCPCSGIIVNQLKSEIQNIQQTLNDLTKDRSELNKSFNVLVEGEEVLAKQIEHLEKENKHLKRDLENKKKICEKTKAEAEHFKTIIDNYEKRVEMLHLQAIDSSKSMTDSKDKLAKCLEEKDQRLKKVMEDNVSLKESLKQKEDQFSELCRKFESLDKLVTVSKEEQDKELAFKLKKAIFEAEGYKTQVVNLEQQIMEMKNVFNKKYENKTKKQKEKYETLIAEMEENQKLHLDKIETLTKKVEECSFRTTEMQTEQTKKINKLKDDFEALTCHCKNVESKLKDHEEFAAKCKVLEQQVRENCEQSVLKDKMFEHEREELKKLVNDLTRVIKHNKVTLMQLTEINKQQEEFIKSQSCELIDKAMKLEKISSEYEMMRVQSEELKTEIECLRQLALDPCQKSTCKTVQLELRNLQNKLEEAFDNTLMKEKLLESQGKLVRELQEKLNQCREVKSKYEIAEKELHRVKEELDFRNRDYRKVLEEKESLMEDFKEVDNRKLQVEKQILNLEKVLKQYCNASKNGTRQKWEEEKQFLNKERERAVLAASFATEKLFETVKEFKFHVKNHKKVQNLLTSLLTRKEEQLKKANSQIDSIRALSCKQGEW